MNHSRLRDATPRLDRRVPPSHMLSRDEYLDGIVRALERNARTTSARLDRALRSSAPKKRIVDVFAISDVHADVKENALAVRGKTLLSRRRDGTERDETCRALVVAGDVGTSTRRVETCLREYKRAFDVVCYLPAGNHELWCAGRVGDGGDGGHTGSYPNDSIGKMWRLIDLCTELDVSCAPIRVGVSGAGRDRGVLLVPTYGWYDDAFAPDASIAGHYSSVEARFDLACAWPTFINPPEDARNSHSPRIGDFMRDVNARVFARFHDASSSSSSSSSSNGSDAIDDDDIVVTYSHFLPRPELYRGYANLWNVMGSTRIDDDARRWSSSAHVFGHSLNVDAVIHGVRYVQHALGYPHERWIGVNEPKNILSASVAA